MNHLYLRAAETVAGEPVSIEPDGTVWADSDHRDINEAAIQAEYERLVAAQTADRQAAIDHAKSLGFTDEMIAVMYPALNAPTV